MERELIALLRTATSARVEWGWVSVGQNNKYPLITVKLISKPRTYNHGGSDGLSRARVQVDIWANTNDEAQSICSQIEPAVDGATLTGKIKTIFISAISDDIVSGDNAKVRRMLELVVVTE